MHELEQLYPMVCICQQMFFPKKRNLTQATFYNQYQDKTDFITKVFVIEKNLKSLLVY